MLEEVDSLKSGACVVCIAYIVLDLDSVASIRVNTGSPCATWAQIHLGQIEQITIEVDIEFNTTNEWMNDWPGTTW